MFKTIISKKKSFLLNSNHVSTPRNENNLIFNSIKFFARKEINKNSFIVNIQRLISEKNESISSLSKNKFELNQDLKNNIDFSNIMKNFSSSIESNDIHKLENVDFKEFYLEFFNTLRKENIDTNTLNTWIKMIEAKYSSNQQINNFGFKLILLIDQIINAHSIETYRSRFNNKFVNLGFDHLIDLFGENFYQENSKSEDLLNNNFLYFMIINKGELSDLFKMLSVKSSQFNINLDKILSTSFKYKNDSDSKINYNNFIDYESNNKCPPSEITNDYSFKYRDSDNKKFLYNNLVFQKQNINKIKYLISNTNNLKNDLVGDLNEIEKILSTFLLREAREILNDDLIKINNELSKFNSILEELLNSLTDLKIVSYNKITINDLENIYNPIFSGEKNLQKQYNRISSILGNEGAQKLLNLFIEKQKKLKSYTFKDLFNMNLIINNKGISLEKNYFNIFINNNENEGESVNLNKKPFILSKQEKVIFDDLKNSLNSILKFSSNYDIQIPQIKSESKEATKKNELNSNLRSHQISGTELSEKKKHNIINPSKKDVRNDKTTIEENKNYQQTNPPMEKNFKNEQIKNKALPNREEKNKNTGLKTSPVKFQTMISIKSEETITPTLYRDNDEDHHKSTNSEIKGNSRFKKIEEKEELLIDAESEHKHHEDITTTNHEYEEKPTLETAAIESFENEHKLLQNIEKEGDLASKYEVENVNKENINEVINEPIENIANQPSLIDNEKKECMGESKVSLTDNNNIDHLTKPNESDSSYKKSDEFISMEEKFKKQKMKKFYYNDNKNYHSLIKRINKSFSSDVLHKDEPKQEASRTIEKNKSSNKEKRRAISDDNLTETNENYFDNYTKKDIKNKKIILNEKSNTTSIKNELEENKKKTIPKFSRMDSNKIFMTKSMYTFKNEKNISDVEDDQNIIKYLEKEDETIKQKIDLSNNDEIVVEANQEMENFSVNYWIEFYQKNKLDKKITKTFETHLLRILKKYKNNEKLVSDLIESITTTSLKSLIYPVDLTKILYNLFIESVNLFDLNLGHNGYFNLLVEVLNKENRRAFEKIIIHMNKYNFTPNDTIYELIINICDKYNYPSFLKNYTDDIVLNKNFILSAKNFTKYIQILSMFKETEEYVINLVDSSYTDFKLPIKSEFYEYLIFKGILQGEYKKIHSFIDSLKKRYTIDYTNEKLRNAEVYSGNLYLINSLIEIVLDQKNIEDSKYNDYQAISLNETEINKIITNLIQLCKEVNKIWNSDEKFARLQYIYLTKININLEDLQNLLDNISKNNKIDLSLSKEIINGIFEKIHINLFSLMKQNNVLEIRKAISILINLLKYNASYLTERNMELMYKEENIRKMNLFLKENPSNENKETIKQFIKESISFKNKGNNYIDNEIIRRLAYTVYEDGKQVSILFAEINRPNFNLENMEN